MTDHLAISKSGVQHQIVLRPIRFRVAVLSFEGITEREGEEKVNLFDRYLKSMYIDPLKEGYIVLVPISQDNTSAMPEAWRIICCRTDAKGLPKKLTFDEATSGSQGSGGDPVYLSEGDEYLYFWTTSSQHFGNIVTALIRNISETLTHNVFLKLRASGAAYDQEMKEWRKSANPLGLLPNNYQANCRLLILRTQLFLDPSWAFAPLIHGRYLVHASEKTEVEEIDYHLLACSPALHAFYRAELAYYHLLGLRQASTKEFTVFHQVMDVSRLTKEKSRVKEIEEENKINVNAEDFYWYAYDCAIEPAVDRDTFCEAIQVTVNYPDRWLAAAQKIFETGIIHPCADQETGSLERWHYKGLYNERPILNYFDFYRYGFEQNVKAWPGIVRFNEKYIEKAFLAVQEKLHNSLARSCTYSLFLKALDLHCPDIAEERLALNNRYLDLMVGSKVSWYEDLGKDSTWKTLKGYLGWLGTLGDKGGELFALHFKNSETALAYNEWLKGNKPAINGMLKELSDFNDRIGGPIMKRRSPDGTITAEIDFEKGTIKVRGSNFREHEVADLLFLKEETETKVKVPMSEAEKRDSAKKLSREKRKEFKKSPKKWFKTVKGTKKTFNLKEPPLKDFHQWPTWLSAFGDSLSLALSIQEIVSGVAKEEGGRAYWKLAQNVFQAMDSLSSALFVAAKVAKREYGMVSRFAKAGAIVKGPGLAIEAYFNMEEGAILVFDDEGEARRSVRKGDMVEAWSLEAKGIVLLGGTVGGVAVGALAAGSAALSGAGVAATVAAGLTPLGIVLAGVGIFVLAIDIGLYIHNGPDNLIDKLDEALWNALKAEYGDDWARNRTLDSIKLFTSRLPILMNG